MAPYIECLWCVIELIDAHNHARRTDTARKNITHRVDIFVQRQTPVRSTLQTQPAELLRSCYLLAHTSADVVSRHMDSNSHNDHMTHSGPLANPWRAYQCSSKLYSNNMIPAAVNRLFYPVYPLPHKSYMSACTGFVPGPLS